MNQINNAYEILINPATRADYDVKGKYQSSQQRQESRQRKQTYDYEEEEYYGEEEEYFSEEEEYFEGEEENYEEEGEYYGEEGEYFGEDEDYFEDPQPQPESDFPRTRGENHRPRHPQARDLFEEQALISYVQSLLQNLAINWMMNGSVLNYHDVVNRKTELEAICNRNAKLLNKIKYLPIGLSHHKHAEKIEELWKKQEEVRSKMMKKMKGIEQIMKILLQ